MRRRDFLCATRQGEMEGSTGAVAARVFTAADFEGVDFRAAGLTRRQFEQYKKVFVGKPVPPQTISDADLVALGYDLKPPGPWVQCCVERWLPNWL